MSTANRKDKLLPQPIKAVMIFFFITAIASPAYLADSANAVTSASDLILMNFKIAFIADTTLNNTTKELLKLIKNEAADMILHQGDLDNFESGSNSPQQWD